MKKTAVLVVCVLLLCGGLCHLYLAAQVKEAENVITLVQSPVADMTFSPTILTAESFVFAETPTPQPVLRPVTAFTPGATLQPVHPVAVVPVKTTPDISKFRLPIEYKLKKHTGRIADRFSGGRVSPSGNQRFVPRSRYAWRNCNEYLDHGIVGGSPNDQGYVGRTRT